MIMVYRFLAWDATSDCYRRSERWATKERIEKLGGECIGDGVEVDDRSLGQRTTGDEVEGMLARGRSPYPPPPHRMG